MKQRLFRDRAAWRGWLEKNHDKASELWLVYYKKHTGKRSVTYQEALDEALCYGWIDSTVNTIDDERYRQRWTPRKPRSGWSARNKQRIAELIDAGKMAAPGLARIEAAKENGSWSQLDKVDAGETPEVLARALTRNKKARLFYEQLAPSARKQYIWWIASAKRDETREQRLKETVRRLAAGIKPGIASADLPGKTKRAAKKTGLRSPRR